MCGFFFAFAFSYQRQNLTSKGFYQISADRIKKPGKRETWDLSGLNEHPVTYIHMYAYIKDYISHTLKRQQKHHYLICGNKMPTRCNRGFYCRSYCLLNMFRAPLCPTSGTQEYYTVVAACGISCCGFQVAGLVWS